MSESAPLEDKAMRLLQRLPGLTRERLGQEEDGIAGKVPGLNEIMTFERSGRELEMHSKKQADMRPRKGY